MASLDFPSNPTNGQTYALNGVTYYYNSSIGAWLTQLTSMNLSTSSNTQVLFNDAGLANGSSGLVFDKGTNALTSLGSIKSTSSTGFVAQNSTATGSNALRIINNSGSFYFGTENSAGTDYSLPAYSTFLYSNYSSPMCFINNGTERMRIDSSGAVGVNITNPSNYGKFVVQTANNYSGPAFVSLGNFAGSNSGSNYANVNALLYTVGGTSNTNTGIGFSGTFFNYPADMGTRRCADIWAGFGHAGQMVWGSEFLAFGVGRGNGGLANDITVTSTERMRISATGLVVLYGGNQTAGGTGIAFPATQSASTDANTLDDYEEGTWTPTFTGLSSGTGSHTQQNGYYVKVGRNVTVWFIIRGSRGTCSGTLVVSGLPYTSFNGVMDYGYMIKVGATWGNWSTSPVFMYASNGNSYIGLWDSGTNFLASTALDASLTCILQGQLNYLSNA